MTWRFATVCMRAADCHSALAAASPAGLAGGGGDVVA